VKSNIKSLYVSLNILVLLVLFNCDSSTSPETDPKVPKVLFTDLVVGQKWQYAKWEKLYLGNRIFTGDSIAVSIIAKEDRKVTFYERPANTDSISPPDTAIFSFQIEDPILRQVGINRSKVFGFVANHDGILTLTDIDSNRVTLDMDNSLFWMREQTGKSRFNGHSDRIELFSDTYENVIIYNDETPIYMDGFGQLAIFSLEECIVTTIYFDGFSLIEQYGYQLIRR
jgi:hypothetical protein